MFPQDLPPPVAVEHDGFDEIERQYLAHLGERLKYLEGNCRLLDRRARKEIKSLRWILGTVCGCTLPESPAVLKDPEIIRRPSPSGSASSEGGSL